MKVLVVEDHPITREFLRHFFEPMAECHVAENGETGVDAVVRSLDEDAPYDLVCMDLRMPKMDGHTALRQIRMIEEERGLREDARTKVIIITASASPADIYQAYEDDCQAYLAKPVDTEQLSARMRELGLILA